MIEGSRLWRRGLARRTRTRPILNHAFERARTPLVEVHPARQRFEPHLEIAVLDADPRQLEDEVVDQLVVQNIDFVALLDLLAKEIELSLVQRIDFGLLVKRVNDRAGIEEQLQDRIEQPAYQTKDAAMRSVEHLRIETMRWLRVKMEWLQLAVACPLNCSTRSERTPFGSRKRSSLTLASS